MAITNGTEPSVEKKTSDEHKSRGGSLVIFLWLATTLGLLLVFVPLVLTWHPSQDLTESIFRTLPAFWWIGLVILVLGLSGLFATSAPGEAIASGTFSKWFPNLPVHLSGGFFVAVVLISFLSAISWYFEYPDRFDPKWENAEQIENNQINAKKFEAIYAIFDGQAPDAELPLVRFYIDCTGARTEASEDMHNVLWIADGNNQQSLPNGKTKYQAQVAPPENRSATIRFLSARLVFSGNTSIDAPITILLSPVKDSAGKSSLQASSINEICNTDEKSISRTCAGGDINCQ